MYETEFFKCRNCCQLLKNVVRVFGLGSCMFLVSVSFGEGGDVFVCVFVCLLAGQLEMLRTNFDDFEGARVRRMNNTSIRFW